MQTCYLYSMATRCQIFRGEVEIQYSSVLHSNLMAAAAALACITGLMAHWNLQLYISLVCSGDCRGRHVMLTGHGQLPAHMSSLATVTAILVISVHIHK